MKEIILVMREVFREFKYKYNSQELEDLICDSSVVLAWTRVNGTWESNQEGFLDFEYEKIARIVEEEVFQYIEKALSKKEIVVDVLIPIIYENAIKNQQRERLGTYYTPMWLVKYVVDNSIAQQINKMESITSLKFLEPACGAGMFLVYVFDILYDWYINNTNFSKEKIVKSIIQDNIYGVDIDQKALRLCKYSLYIKMFKITKKNVDVKFNLYNTDYLKEESTINSNFHFIIGNPPYLENRRINKYFDKEDLKNRFSTAVGRFDIYSLFIEKSLQIMKNTGILAFVLPGNLLTNNNFSVIRKLILDKTDVLEIVNLGDKIFQGVNMNMAIIVLQKNSSVSTKHLIKCKNLRGDTNINECIFNTEYRLIPQIYFSRMTKNPFDINSSEVVFKLREKVFKEGYTRINDVCEIIAGIATGNIRNKLLTKNNNELKAKKVLEGKNIGPYYHKWGHLYFIDDKSIIDKDKGEYATFMRKEFIEEKKILIRQTADRFICSYDDQGFYLLNTLYSLRVRDEYRCKVNIKYILGLLNSKLYSFLYRSIVGESGKLFPQVKIFHIQNSAIIIAKDDIQNKVSEKVDKIICLKKILRQDSAAILGRSNELKTELEILIQEIDLLVYNLFKLTSKEIREIEKETIY